MAVQNFLSGGYYGKLGATVGQRWKNKRTIRTYVKPSNPRTEIQQANRNKFANAVTFAQMGMQMNYYATVFEDPNFTQWNYRMKVARELKDKGLSGLDLIPLYPTSIVPSVILQKFAIAKVQGKNHISFKVENLNGDTDRVFSLMFAIHDENDVFLGYKLYLGYYYSSNKGFMEVDVDDVKEINIHCFVRIVTNDDVDSVTDMIASPTLQIEKSGPTTQIFNTNIREVNKSTNGFTVSFEQPWQEGATVNYISVSASFVSSGTVTIMPKQDNLSLVNNNGYCSVFVPYTTNGGWELPCFPSGSYFQFSVDFENEEWIYKAENVTVQFSDTDLVREFNGTWTFSADTDGYLYWTTNSKLEFNSKNFNGYLKCSGRLDLHTEEQVQVGLYSMADETMRIDVEGDFAQWAMRDGDYLRIEACDIDVNGVTYRIPASTLYGVNTYKYSYWLRNSQVTKVFKRSGGSSVGQQLNNLWIEITGIKINGTITYDNNWISEIETTEGNYLEPTTCTVSVGVKSASEKVLLIDSSFNNAAFNKEVDTTCRITFASWGTMFDYNGITYRFPTMPFTVGGWNV